MLPYRFLAAVAAATVSICLAATATLPMDAPLVTDGAVVVDRADFEGALLKLPEQYRSDARLSQENVATIIDGVYVARELAAKARIQGLDKDPAVRKRLQQAQESVLADLYLQKVEAATGGNLEQRAHELYLADRSKYVAPEQVYVQQILVDLKGKTVEMAREKAQKVADEARAGKDEFLAYALKYSDEDPPKGGLRGDLGWFSPTSFVDPVREALAKMKKGEIAGPVQSKHGFHILKLVDRKPERQLTFEQAKDSIVAAEKDRLKKERIDAIVREIRSSPTAAVNQENVDALVVKVDPDALKRAEEAAANLRRRATEA
jgi:parvulin-like peptidyl-prolyl isomerase